MITALYSSRRMARISLHTTTIFPFISIYIVSTIRECKQKQNRMAGRLPRTSRLHTRNTIISVNYQSSVHILIYTHKYVYYNTGSDNNVLFDLLSIICKLPSLRIILESVKDILTNYCVEMKTQEFCWLLRWERFGATKSLTTQQLTQLCHGSRA